MKSTKNKLIDLCMPLFESLRLIQSEKARDLPQSFGETLFNAMMTLEYQGLENQVPSHHITDAKYAVAALLDESIMRSDWNGKNSWMDQSLQLRLFGEHLAGVNFFERLARIRQSPELNVDVLEVYFVCLQLGFQGRFAMSQQEELKSLQVDIKHQLDLYQGKFNPALFFETSTTNDDKRKGKFELPIWLIFGSIALVIALLYSYYAVKLGGLHQTNEGKIQDAISHIKGM